LIYQHFSKKNTNDHDELNDENDQVGRNDNQQQETEDIDILNDED
jgi:hypothetical protein